MRVTFSQSPMVSGAVSKLGCTEVIFVEPGAKINGEYYGDVLLQKLLIYIYIKNILRILHRFFHS